MNIFLVGYRGSGKTTVAAALAQQLNWNWLDADVELERRQGKTIKEIFATQGELPFRDYESAILADLAKMQRHILALGGGVVLREQNRQLLKAHGQTVWLQAPAEVLWQRIQGDVTTAARRPNLTAHGGIEEIRTLLAQREPLYTAVADAAIAADQPPSEIARQIISAFKL